MKGNGSLPVTSVSTSKFFSRVLIIPQPIANSRGASLSLKSPLRSVTKKLANLEKIIKFIKIVILVSSDFVHSRDFFNQHTTGIIQFVIIFIAYSRKKQAVELRARQRAGFFRVLGRLTGWEFENLGSESKIIFFSRSKKRGSKIFGPGRTRFKIYLCWTKLMLYKYRIIKIILKSGILFFSITWARMKKICMLFSI